MTQRQSERTACRASMYGVNAGASQKQYALGPVPRGRPWDEFKPKQIGRRQICLTTQRAEARRREEDAMSNPWQTSSGAVGSFVPAELAPPRAMAHPPRAAREASRHGAIGGSDALGAVDAQRERERRDALAAMRERKARQVEDSVRWAPKAAPAPAPSHRAPPAGINMSTLGDEACGGGSSSSPGRADQMSRMAAPDRRRMAALLAGQDELAPAKPPSRILLRKPRWMTGDEQNGVDAPPPRRTELMDSRRAILEAAAAEEAGGAQGAHPLDPARVGKPGGLWQGMGEPSHADKVRMAVAELRRRQPQLTEMEALRKVGVALAHELNASDGAARDYFRLRGRAGQ